MNTERRDLHEVFEEIGEVALLLWEKGWAERNAGNISVRVTGWMDEDAIPFDGEQISESGYRDLAGEAFLFTGTGTRMRDIARRPELGLCQIQFAPDGLSYRRKDCRKGLSPTSELPTHLSLHAMLLKEKPSIRAVVHTHCTELIALTQLKEFTSQEEINRHLWSMHPETMMFVPEGVGFVPYQLPGTDSIAEKSVEALRDHSVVVWEKHGVIATGRTVNEAFDTIDLLAKSAKIYFLCKSTGVEPMGLTESQLREIRRLIERLDD